VLKGGKGADTFVFSPDLGAVKNGKTKDFAKVLDLKPGKDAIELDVDVFTAIGPSLEAEEFGVGRKASREDHHILYHRKSGNLLYDVDGKGGADAVAFGRSGKHLDIDEAHFILL
jgi:Ca2+-binding RTX toxin-like protein